MVNRFLMLTPYSAVMMITSPTSSAISSVVSMFLPTGLSSTIYISPAALSFHQHSLYWVIAMWLLLAGNSMHYTYTAISNSFLIGQHNDVFYSILLLFSELGYYPRLIYCASHFYVADFL